MFAAFIGHCAKDRVFYLGTDQIRWQTCTPNCHASTQINRFNGRKMYNSGNIDFKEAYRFAR
jgi:hypothetical protein